MLYNHACSIAFECLSRNEDGPTESELWAGLRRRVRILEAKQDDISEAALPPHDTIEIEGVEDVPPLQRELLPFCAPPIAPPPPALKLVEHPGWTRRGDSRWSLVEFDLQTRRASRRLTVSNGHWKLEYLDGEWEEEDYGDWARDKDITDLLAKIRGKVLAMP